MFSAAVPDSADARAESVLGRRQLYMLPTRYGLLFALVLAVHCSPPSTTATVLATGSPSCSGVSRWCPCCIPTATCIACAWRPRCVPVFAGESARFEVTLVNDADAPRYGVCLEYAGESIACVDIAAHGRASVALNLPARRRGNSRGRRFA